jgi:hypothetical protein
MCRRRLVQDDHGGGGNENENDDFSSCAKRARLKRATIYASDNDVAADVRKRMAAPAPGHAAGHVMRCPEWMWWMPAGAVARRARLFFASYEMIQDMPGSRAVSRRPTAVTD